MKLVVYDHGYWTVEASGELYSVFGTLVDAGFEYEVNGRWLPGNDPRVMARKKEETLVNSPPIPAFILGASIRPLRECLTAQTIRHIADEADLVRFQVILIPNVVFQLLG